MVSWAGKYRMSTGTRPARATASMADCTNDPVGGYSAMSDV
nr:hypothetical protein [Streptosporangium roseum]